MNQLEHCNPLKCHTKLKAELEKVCGPYLPFLNILLWTLTFLVLARSMKKV